MSRSIQRAALLQAPFDRPTTATHAAVGINMSNDPSMYRVLLPSHGPAPARRVPAHFAPSPAVQPVPAQVKAARDPLFRPCQALAVPNPVRAALALRQAAACGVKIAPAFLAPLAGLPGGGGFAFASHGPLPATAGPPAGQTAPMPHAPSVRSLGPTGHLMDTFERIAVTPQPRVLPTAAPAPRAATTAAPASEPPKHTAAPAPAPQATKPAEPPTAAVVDPCSECWGWGSTLNTHRSGEGQHSTLSLQP